jgi:putative endonuclease
MFWVYVIYSKKFDKIYIGQTIDLNLRIEEHNGGLSKHTNKFKPWDLVYSEHVENRTLALKRERQLKSSRGRSFIWKDIIGKEKY